MNKTFEDLRMTYQNLENYILSEIHIQDKGNEGRQMVNDIRTIIEDYYKVNNLIMFKIDELSIDAEEKILATHPLKNFILKMRDCTDLVSEFVDKTQEGKKQYTENKSFYVEKYQLIKKWQGELLQFDKKP